MQQAPSMRPPQNWQSQSEKIQKWCIKFDRQVENGKYGTFQGIYYPKQIALKANNEGYQGDMEIDMNMQHMQTSPYTVPPPVQSNQLQALMVDSLTAPPPSYSSAPPCTQKPSTQMPALTQANRLNVQYGSNANNTDQSAMTSVSYATSTPLNNKDEVQKVNDNDDMKSMLINSEVILNESLRTLGENSMAMQRNTSEMMHEFV